ncbi:MAG: YtxH domain-containing protein [Phormidesmis sp.]
MANNKSDGLLGGMVIGAALGAIAGILAAPRTGKETRRILKKSADALPELAEDLATSIQFQADKLSDTTLQNWDQTLDRLREAIVAGQAASRQEWQKQQDMPSTRAPMSNYPRDEVNSTMSAVSDSASPGISSPDMASKVIAEGDQSTS